MYVLLKINLRFIKFGYGVWIDFFVGRIFKYILYFKV